MATPKKYFHDHLVLLLASLNAFAAMLAVILVLLRLSSGHGSGYIVQYRSSLGINAFKTGSVSNLLSFVVFALLSGVVNIGLSLKIYRINRHLALSILSLGLLLLVLSIIVSNALLVLR
jgi:hypothetical protein